MLTRAPSSPFPSPLYGNCLHTSYRNIRNILCFGNIIIKLVRIIMMLPSNTHTHTHIRGHTQSHMYLHAEVCKRERAWEREGHPCDKARLELGRRPLLVETFLLAYGMKWRCLLHILPQLLFLFLSHSLLFFFLRFFVDFTSPSKNMKYTTNNLLPSVCVCCRSWTGSNGGGEARAGEEYGIAKLTSWPRSIAVDTWHLIAFLH